jgi:competence protein ComEC
LTKYPAVKILIGVLTGFIISKLVDIDTGLLFPFIIVLAGIFFALLLLKYFRLALIIGSVTIGILLFVRSESFELKRPSKIIQPFTAVLQGEVIDVLKSNNKNTRLIIRGNIISPVTKKIEQQNVLLTVFHSSFKSPQLNIGTRFHADCKIRPPKPDILPLEFSESQYAKANDIQWFATASAANLSIIEHSKSYKHFISAIREDISERVDSLFSEKTEGIAICLLTGDKSKIPFEVKQDFSFAGTAHVLAVSGLHVGIIAIIIYLLLGFIGNSWLKFFVFTVIVVSFIILTGSHASSVRAGFMAIAIMLCFTIQRDYDPLNIVALVVLIVLIISPNMIYSVGFQMSVAAITGIIIFYRPIRKTFSEFAGKKYNSYFHGVFSSLSLTFAASITVAPIIAYYFDVFSIISPITNLLVIPLISLGMIFSILSLLTSYLYFPIAELYAVTSDLTYSISMDINSFAVSIPKSYTSGDISFPLALIVSIVIIYFFVGNHRKLFPFRLKVSTILILLSLIVFLPDEKNGIEIYPRENVVAAFVPHNDSLFVMIMDRKPSQYPSVDLSLLKYIESSEKELIIGINGNSGIALTDILKKSRRFKLIEIPIDQQREIAKAMKLKIEFSQIIEY